MLEVRIHPMRNQWLDQQRQLLIIQDPLYTSACTPLHIIHLPPTLYRYALMPFPLSLLSRQLMLPPISTLVLATRWCKSWLPAVAPDSPPTELSVDSNGSVPRASSYDYNFMTLGLSLIHI